MNALGLTFANPALWAGALAVAAPLLAHLLARRTPVRMVFPMVRFLKAAEASQSLPYRLRHLIMLLVRTALVLLLLLAFVKPVLRAKASAAAPGSDGKQAVAIVLDASLSMDYAGSGFTPFMKGKAAARRIVETLGPADAVNLIRAGAVPRSSFQQPMANTAGLLRDLERAEPTLERADVDAAIAEAVKQLERLGDHARQIHFISDFQRSNWASAKFSTIPEGVQTLFVSVAEESPANTAVTEVMLHPAAPAAGESMDVQVKVANYGPQGREVPVELHFADAVEKREASVAPGMTETVRFRTKPEKEGLYEGTIRIGEDALGPDNARYFTVNASDRLRVLILTDENAYEPLASHRFLARAVNPANAETAAVVATVRKPEQFDRFAAADAHLVMLAGVRALPQAAARQLVEYLRDGGGVIYFLGHPADKENLDLLVKLSEGALELPFRVGGLRDYREARSDRYATFAGANFDDPILRKFKEHGSLGEAQFYRCFATEREKGQGQVLLRYDDENIAMARKSLGLGSLLLCNFSPGLEGSDLAKRPLFVPFVHEMIRNMRPQSGGLREFHVGSAASTTIKLASTNAPLLFRAPTGERINGTFEENHGEAAVFFPATETTGFYRIDAGEAHAGSVAVNVDPRESNLEALTVEQLRELANVPRDRFLATTAADIDAVGALLAGRPLWHWFLLAALCLAGVEQALAWVWRS